MEDYDHLLSENASLKTSLAQYTDIANKTMAECESLRNQIRMQGEFLTRQIDLITTQRDRLLSALKGLTTRFKVIKECFAQCEREALAEGVVANEKVAELSSEDEQALANLNLGGNGTWRDKLASTK